MATGDAASIEEERRLLYVAMTRARDVLEVYFPLRYHRRPRGVGDAHALSQLTRFIPDGVRALFDDRVAGDQPLPGGESDSGSAGTAAVDEALRELWAG